VVAALRAPCPVNIDIRRVCNMMNGFALRQACAIK
jgi:hypothetical protein